VDDLDELPVKCWARRTRLARCAKCWARTWILVTYGEAGKKDVLG
jgi:hypothetical protein